MNAVQHHTHTGIRPGTGSATGTRPEHSAATVRRSGTFDWAGQVKLAVVLSAVAVIVTVGLAGRVAEPVIVIGLMAVASVLAWRRVDLSPAHPPTPVRVRHR